MAGKSKSKIGFIDRLLGRNPLITQAAGSAVRTAIGLSGESAEASESRNSGAMLKNMKEASADLDKYLQDIDKFDAERHSADILSISRQVEKQQSYSNARFTGLGLEEVKLTETESRLSRLAAMCSEKVYARQHRQVVFPSREYNLVDKEITLKGGYGGSVQKPAVVGVYMPSEKEPQTSGRLVTVVIRGTASVHDWMVNFNPGPGDDDPASKDNFLGKDETEEPYCIHEGFLSATKGIMPLVTKALTQVLDTIHQKGNTETKPELLFAGHSAGGAVAAMLYTRLLRYRAENDDDVEDNDLIKFRDDFSQIHCITFGTPPITTLPIRPFHLNSTFISFVNEGDPVPRADSAYISSLLQLYVTKSPVPGQKWTLPPRKFFNAGRVLISPRAGVRRKTDTCTYLIPRDSGEGSLAETVMGDPRAHRMAAYLWAQGAVVTQIRTKKQAESGSRTSGTLEQDDISNC